MTQNEEPTTKRRDVREWIEKSAHGDSFTVVQVAPDIGVENDGGLLRVETLLNCAFPLISIENCPALTTDDALTLLEMVASAIGLIKGFDADEATAEPPPFGFDPKDLALYDRRTHVAMPEDLLMYLLDCMPVGYADQTALDRAYALLREEESS